LHKSAPWQQASRTRHCRARLTKTALEYEDLKTELAGEGGDPSAGTFLALFLRILVVKPLILLLFVALGPQRKTAR